MRNVFLNIVIIICLIVFAVCAYKLFDYFYGNMEADQAVDKQRDMVADVVDYDSRLPEYEKMKEENKDFRGWIIADGTNVNNPLVQRVDDQDYYLDHDYEGNPSRAGAIFLSSVADVYKPSDVITVFGHHMRDKTMFGSLDRYEDSEFLQKHDRIWLDSLEKRREFEVTNVMRIRVDVDGTEDVFPYYQYSDFEDEDDFNKFAEQCKAHNIYDTGKTIEYGDKFVILSTCEYTYGDGSGRLVIMGKEVPVGSGTDIAEAEITKPMMGTYVMLGLGVAIIVIILTFIVSMIRGSRRRKARANNK